MVSTRTNEDVTRGLTDALNKMNLEQKNIFDRTLSKAMPGVCSAYPDGLIFGDAESKVFFLDAHGSTGTTFTLKTLQDILRLKKRKVITVATSAVAASLPDCSTTAHSALKIPVPSGS